ncbi:MAG TPA: methyltransferase type 11, partial [Streptosporangiaceae bacterium]
DHLRDNEAEAPTLTRLGKALTQRLDDRQPAPVEDWKGWWEAVTQDPALAGPAAQREARRLTEDHHGSESLLFSGHVGALRAAGFTEVGTLWQYGENRIMCAVLGS